MKSGFIIFNLLWVLCTINGQVAIIQDPDGWTNVREAPNSEAEVFHKLFENEVFWYLDEDSGGESEWISVFIPKNKHCLAACTTSNYVKGYIHKSRLQPLENLGEAQESELIFHYELKEFDSKNRIIDLHEGKWITAIDGLFAWGIDGFSPKTQVEAIEVRLKGKILEIHDLFFQDIFECTNNFTVYKNKEVYFVHQWNSDGAGAYEIVWVFDSTGLIQRLVGSII